MTFAWSKSQSFGRSIDLWPTAAMAMRRWRRLDSISRKEPPSLSWSLWVSAQAAAGLIGVLLSFPCVVGWNEPWLKSRCRIRWSPEAESECRQLLPHLILLLSFNLDATTKYITYWHQMQLNVNVLFMVGKWQTLWSPALNPSSVPAPSKSFKNPQSKWKRRVDCLTCGMMKTLCDLYENNIIHA